MPMFQIREPDGRTWSTTTANPANAAAWIAEMMTVLLPRYMSEFDGEFQIRTWSTSIDPDTGGLWGALIQPITVPCTPVEVGVALRALADRIDPAGAAS